MARAALLSLSFLRCVIADNMRPIAPSPSDLGANAPHAVCGDGVLQAMHGETCDDGNLMSNDGCSSTCTLEHGYSCLPAGLACVHLDKEYYTSWKRTDPARERDILVSLYQSCSGAEWREQFTKRWLESGPYPRGQPVRDARGDSTAGWSGITGTKHARKRGALVKLELQSFKLNCHQDAVFAVRPSSSRPSSTPWPPFRSGLPTQLAELKLLSTLSLEGNLIRGHLDALIHAAVTASRAAVKPNRWRSKLVKLQLMNAAISGTLPRIMMPDLGFSI